MISNSEGRIVHMPSKPDRFEFDEVAPVFDDMAQRSIPLYRYMHDMQSRIIANHFRHTATKIAAIGSIKPVPYPYTVVDLGTSTGATFGYMQNLGLDLAGMQCVGMDGSQSMLDIAAERYPDVTFQHADFGNDNASYIIPAADVIVCNHLIQFLRGRAKRALLSEVRTRLSSNGILFISHKSLLRDPTGLPAEPQAVDRAIMAAAHDTYMQFRIDNGYSEDEIEAKTRALKSIMRCTRDIDVINAVIGAATNIRYHRLFQFGEFTSMVFYKV